MFVNFIKNKLFLFLVMHFIFSFCVSNIYAKSSLLCPKCGSDNIKLLKTNSQKGLEEKIYFCNECKGFSSFISYNEDVEKIINGEDIDIDNSDNTDDSDIAVNENKSTNIIIDKNSSSSKNYSDDDVVNKNIQYPDEPEEDSTIIKKEKIERCSVKRKDISLTTIRGGALVLLNVLNNKYYKNSIVTIVDNDNKEMITWYFGADSTMQIGWKLIDNKWYYFSIENNNFIGNMSVGWKNINGKYYYFDLNGQLLVNTITPDGYKVNNEGEYYVN